MAKAKMYKRPNGLYEKVYTIDGKKVHFYGKTEREILEKYRNYQTKKTEEETFTSVADKWREQYENQVEYYTFHKSNAHYLRAVDYFGDTIISEITPQNVNQFYLYLANKKYAKKTITNQKSVLNNIFKYAIIKGFITSNPADYVDIPHKLPQTKRELPSDKDIQKVKDNINFSCIGLLAYIVMYTGCRRGEALALQYKDIDFINKKISISKAVYYKNSKACIKSTKTIAGIRTVPLLNALEPYLKPNNNPDDYIISGHAPLTESQFKRWWKKYADETKQNSTLHQLRHAYATMLYEAGIDEKVAQELMGHTDIQTTRNIYTHIRTSRIDEAAEKLNNLDF